MRILVAEKSSFSERGLAALEAIAPVEARDLSQAELAGAVGDFDILALRLGLRVEAETLAAGQRLQIIGSPTTGLDHIDLEAAAQHNVAVLSLKGERLFLDQVYATAEHAFALLLSLVRCVPAAFAAVQEYEWRRDRYRGREINGMTLGIVGCGRLGTMAARYGAGFGMQVLAYDPY
jgi:D-3-phosphoglycerate dehydrogenase